MPKKRLEDKIKMDFRKLSCEDVKWRTFVVGGALMKC